MIKTRLPSVPRNTAEHRNTPGVLFPERPPRRGRPEHRVDDPEHGRNAAPDQGFQWCPACGAPSTYDEGLDRYFHADGSDVRECWLQIHRGVTLEVVPHALYRFWAGEELLYVGITMNPPIRWNDHRREKTWWREVTKITIEYHPTREMALAAEKAAIQRERPKHNVVGNRDKAARAAMRGRHDGEEVGA